MESPPLLGSSRTTGGILRGRALGNALNYADFRKTSEDDSLAGPAQITFNIMVYIVYGDPIRFNVTPDDSARPTTFFKVTTVPPLESAIVLQKVVDRLETVTGM